MTRFKSTVPFGRSIAKLIDVEENAQRDKRQTFLEAIEEGSKATTKDDHHCHTKALEIFDSFGKGST